MFLELEVKSFSGPYWVQWTKLHDTTNFGTGTLRSRDFPQRKKTTRSPNDHRPIRLKSQVETPPRNVPQRSISPMGIQDSGMNEKYRESCTSSKWWFPMIPLIIIYLWDIFTGPLEVQWVIFATSGALKGCPFSLQLHTNFNKKRVAISVTLLKW